MRFEPTLGIEAVGAGLLEQGPEPGGMVHLFLMDQLVKDDVVADERRHLDEAPVQ